jgi:transcriptional regulator with XRE-family HTH domain
MKRISSAQCRAARALIGLKQIVLAGLTGVNRRTIQGFENDQTVPNQATLTALRVGLEDTGIRFAFDDPDQLDGVWRIAKEGPRV